MSGTTKMAMTSTTNFELPSGSSETYGWCHSVSVHYFILSVPKQTGANRGTLHFKWDTSNFALLTCESSRTHWHYSPTYIQTVWKQWKESWFILKCSETNNLQITPILCNNTQYKNTESTKHTVNAVLIPTSLTAHVNRRTMSIILCWH